MWAKVLIFQGTNPILGMGSLSKLIYRGVQGAAPDKMHFVIQNAYLAKSLRDLPDHIGTFFQYAEEPGIWPFDLI